MCWYDGTVSSFLKMPVGQAEIYGPRICPVASERASAICRRVTCANHVYFVTRLSKHLKSWYADCRYDSAMSLNSDKIPIRWCITHCDNLTMLQIQQGIWKIKPRGLVTLEVTESSSSVGLLTVRPRSTQCLIQDLVYSLYTVPYSRPCLVHFTVPYSKLRLVHFHGALVKTSIVYLHSASFKTSSIVHTRYLKLFKTSSIVHFHGALVKTSSSLRQCLIGAYKTSSIVYTRCLIQYLDRLAYLHGALFKIQDFV